MPGIGVVYDAPGNIQHNISMITIGLRMWLGFARCLHVPVQLKGRHEFKSKCQQALRSAPPSGSPHLHLPPRRQSNLDPATICVRGCRLQRARTCCQDIIRTTLTNNIDANIDIILSLLYCYYFVVVSLSCDYSIVVLLL